MSVAHATQSSLALLLILGVGCSDYGYRSPVGPNQRGAGLTDAPSTQNGGDTGAFDGGDDNASGDDDDDDDDDDNHDDDSACDVPYAVRPGLGDVFRLTDAFAEEGELPSAIVSVTMDDGDWRLAELQADTPFTVTDADCSHEGNRDTGRDRIFVTWVCADGSQDTDHLDIRYCD